MKSMRMTNMYTKRNFCAVYYEEMYLKYMENPNSVTKDWRAYFEGKESSETGYGGKASYGSIDGDALAEAVASKIGNVSGVDSSQTASEVVRILNLVRSYQTVGHEKAKLDPLKLREIYGNIYQIGKRKRSNVVQLDYRFHGLADEHLDKEYSIHENFKRGLLSIKKKWKLRDLIEALEIAYCGSIGLEFMHIMELEECAWFRERFEEGYMDKISDEKRIQAYDRLAWACLYGDFMQSKYNTQKRFGLEGCEAFIVGIKTTIDKLVESGVESVTIGMPHRGRLNVLANVMRKPLNIIFQEFIGESKTSPSDEWERSGDVKYHLGTSFKRTYEDTGKSVEVHLLPNPSHLELVDPVVCGYVRATQHNEHDQDRSKHVGILVHGDAAFAGQGILFETMQMSGLKNYSTGGTIHFVVNNQIGFTTTPMDARSGIYCTELAKSVNAPIIHVNGDDVDAVEK
jgi:2-oxoglutarate dehydrogenase E1 component